MNTAALIIDVQVGLVSGAYNETQLLENINRVITAVRAKGGHVVFIQHCHASYQPLMKDNASWALHPALDARGDDTYIEKTASDSFYQTELAEVLDAMNVAELYITGLQTEYCVDATCRAAQGRGYSVNLVEDAHTTGDSQLPAATIIAHHNAVLANLAHPDHPIRLVSSSAV
ncbi:MAG: isochorismatase family protein [Pseudomonadales bacterium]